MQQYSALKREETLTPAPARVDLEATMLSEISQARKATSYVIPLLRGPWRRFIETERRRVAAGAGGGVGSECLMGPERRFGKVRKFWR